MCPYSVRPTCANAALSYYVSGHVNSVVVGSSFGLRSMRRSRVVTEKECGIGRFRLGSSGRRLEREHRLVQTRPVICCRDLAIGSLANGQPPKPAGWGRSSLSTRYSDLRGIREIVHVARCCQGVKIRINPSYTNRASVRLRLALRHRFRQRTRRQTKQVSRPTSADVLLALCGTESHVASTPRFARQRVPSRREPPRTAGHGA